LAESRDEEDQAGGMISTNSCVEFEEMVLCAMLVERGEYVDDSHCVMQALSLSSKEGLVVMANEHSIGSSF